MKKLASALKINSIGGEQTHGKEPDYGFIFSDDNERWIHGRKLIANRKNYQRKMNKS